MPENWLSNPLVRIALQFGAACLAVGYLSRWAPLDYVATGAAGCLAATIWILEYEPDLATKLGAHGALQSWMNLVAGWSGQTASAQTGAENVDSFSWRLTESELDTAERQARLAVRGHDAAITRIVDAIRRSANLRQSSTTAPAMPLGAFLLVGGQSVGKRTLAMCLAGQFCGSAGISWIDAGQAEWTPPVMSGRGRAALVIENVDRASPKAKDWIRAALEGRTGGTNWPVSESLIFLIVHGDAARLPSGSANGGAGTGGTVMAGAVAAQTGLDSRILWACHELIPMPLPAARELADVVLTLMRRECESHGILLDHVDPAVVAHEVALITASQSFDELPGRIGRRLAPQLYAARMNHSSRLRL